MNIPYYENNNYVMTINDEVRVGFQYFGENAEVLNLEDGIYVPVLSVTTNLTGAENGSNYIELFLPFINGEQSIDKIILEATGDEEIVFLNTEKYHKLINISTDFASSSREYRGHIKFAY